MTGSAVGAPSGQPGWKTTTFDSVRNALAQRAAQHRAGSSDGLVEHAEALRALA